MDALKESLRKAIERNLESKDLQKVDDNLSNPEDDDDALFEMEFKKVNLGIKDETSTEQSREKIRKIVPDSLNIVPPFYVGLPPENDDLRQKLREEARAQFLQRRSKALLDNEELKALYSLLEANASSSKAFSSDGNSSTELVPKCFSIESALSSVKVLSFKSLVCLIKCLFIGTLTRLLITTSSKLFFPLFFLSLLTTSVISSRISMTAF